MGWTGQYEPTRPNVKERMRAEFSRDPNWGTIVEDGAVGSTYYAAIKNTKTGEVWGLVCLTSYSAKDREFMHKEMSDTMGPNESKAPQKVLRALSETDNEYANEWRKRCWQYHADRKKAAARQSKVDPNEKLIYAPGGKVQDLTWGDGKSCNEFYVRDGVTRRGRAKKQYIRATDRVGVSMPVRLKRHLLTESELRKARAEREAAMRAADQAALPQAQF